MVPNYCDIGQNVNVELHYYSNERRQWMPVLIQPYQNAPGPGYYNDSNNYQHQNTLYFVQYLRGYYSTSGNASEVAARMQEMYAMFETFIADRGISLKLVITTEINGIPSEFYSYMTRWQGLPMDCYDDITVHHSRYNITVDAPGDTAAHCMWLLERAEAVDVTVYLQEDGKAGYQRTATVSARFFQLSDILGFGLEEEWPLNTS